MKVISGNKIAQVIQDITPKKIAVAFVGEDWNNYLKDETLKGLESIVVSPTEGSNPKAIRAIVEKNGWERVHFLKRLHAKIYIGPDYSIVGSANLSKNGLLGDESGLFETCVKFKTNDDINEIYDAILNEAHKNFNTPQAKNEELKRLQGIWNRRIAASLSKETQRKNVQFQNFDIKSFGNICLDWFEYAEPRPSVKKGSDIGAHVSSFEDWVYVNSIDQIAENDWVLYWRRTDKSKKMKKKSKLKWTFIHKIFWNVVNEKTSDGYSSLAVQYENQPIPQVPFEITNEFRDAFCNIINHPQYDDLRMGEFTKWGKEMPFVIKTDRIKVFFDDVKKEMERLNKHLIKD